MWQTNKYGFVVTCDSPNIQQELLEDLRETEISVVEEFKGYMGGSPYDFSVEGINKDEANKLAEAIRLVFSVYGFIAKVEIKKE